MDGLFGLIVLLVVMFFAWQSGLVVLGISIWLLSSAARALAKRSSSKPTGI